VWSILDEHGLTPADISRVVSGARARSKVAGKKVQPKYRHPEHGATWTGRGLKPKWLSHELETGKKLTDFAI
jgi:DNA-binding protein H-NS